MDFRPGEQVAVRAASYKPDSKPLELLSKAVVPPAHNSKMF